MSARGCPVSQAHDVRALMWEHWREADAHRALQDSAGRLLLMFGRHGCGSCRQAYAHVPLLAVGAVDRLVHLDADDCGGLLREFDVFHLPALFLFRAGRFHAPLHAALTEPGFAQAIERVLVAPAQEAP